MNKENILKVIAITLATLIGVFTIMSVLNEIKEGSLNSEFRNLSPDSKHHLLPDIGTLPGVGKFDENLLRKFRQRRKELGSRHKPRTRHKDETGLAKYTNRLFMETSPYLLQHAHNPVNWYPWGDEAFRMAKKLNRPILLSIGYSTCYWCHIMEEESFDDEQIAKVMNEKYIAIKVDREERPDIDVIYMSAVQVMTGRGGWPMTVWLTPDKKPFYGGTYFPARSGDRGSKIGFLDLLKKLYEFYKNKPDKVAKSSQDLVSIIQKKLTPSRSDSLPKVENLKAVIEYYKDRFDSVDGGLFGAPKFPSSLPLQLFFRYYRRTQDKVALRAALFSLKKMSSGGIYDHVGGGFHRYSTDSKWLVPHFEKMLYVNALLAPIYLEAYQITGDLEFKRITQEILRYIKRDMTSPEGAFYSATDADSLNLKGHREEGWFFTWTLEEIKEALSEEDSKLMIDYYGISAHGDFEGRNILNTPNSISKVAKKFKLSESQARKKVSENLERLYHARLKRPRPFRDEKILTSWNALMISAYAKAGLILNEVEYLTIAKTAAHFILENLYKNKRLLRAYKDGEAKLNAYLDDIAFLIAALLDLYEATSEIRWLAQAIEFDQALEKHYEDKKAGGFFMTRDDHEKLLIREKPAYDGAEPSGNSVSILNLLRLEKFTTNDNYRKRAEKALKAFSGTLKSNPIALSEMLLSVDFYLDTVKEIIIVSPRGKKSTSAALLSQFRKIFLPNRIVLFVEEGDELERHAKIIPIVKSKYAIEGKPTAYVCENGLCELPTSDPDTFAKQIMISVTTKRL